MVEVGDEVTEVVADTEEVTEVDETDFIDFVLSVFFNPIVFTINEQTIFTKICREGVLNIEGNLGQIQSACKLCKFSGQGKHLVLINQIVNVFIFVKYICM